MHLSLNLESHVYRHSQRQGVFELRMRFVWTSYKKWESYSNSFVRSTNRNCQWLIYWLFQVEPSAEEYIRFLVVPLTLKEDAPSFRQPHPL